MNSILKQFRAHFITNTLLVSLLIAISVAYFSSLDQIPLYIDEWLFIGKSYYFDLFFVERNIPDQRWYKSDGFLAEPLQPKLGPYIYGAALHIAGIPNIQTHFQTIKLFNLMPIFRLNSTDQEIMNALTWLESGESHRVFRLIYLGRKTSTVFALLALIYIAIITKKLLGSFYSLTTTFLVATNGLMLTISRRAMTDAMQLLFFLLNFIFINKQIELISKKASKQFLLVSLLIGINLGFAVSTKTTGILIIPFALLTYIFILSKNKWQKTLLTKLIVSGVISLISALIIFISLHPYLYTNTPKRMAEMFTHRFTYEQSRASPSTERPIQSQLLVNDFIYQNLFFEKGEFSLLRFGTLPINAMLFGIGSLLLLKKSLEKKHQYRVPMETLLLMWMLTTMIGLRAYLYTDWPRYYLPALTIVIMIEAYTISAILLSITKIDWKRLHNSISQIGKN